MAIAKAIIGFFILSLLAILGLYIIICIGISCYKELKKLINK